MKRLLPDRRDDHETSVEDEVGGLDLVGLAAEERPYVITNFAITLDGHATISGRSGAIGSDTDTRMLVALRTRVDAVMIGAGTMRAERYGRVVGDPAKRERRERDGLAHDPLMVIVSGQLDLPWDAPLFTEGAGEVLSRCTYLAHRPASGSGTGRRSRDRGGPGSPGGHPETTGSPGHRWPAWW